MTIIFPCVMAFGLSLFLPIGASAAKPSFDCAKARSVAEKAICRNSDLATLDTKIAAEYRTLQSELDPKSAAALADDQRWFIATRDGIAETPKSMTPPALDTVLKDRVRFLGAINPRPPAGFVGTWRNLAGGFDIKVGANAALRIEGEAAQPVNGNWVCEYYGVGKSVDNLLEPKTEAMDDQSKLVAADANAGSVRLSREGASLKVETIVAPIGDANPFCGMNGSLNGTYFLVSPGYDRFPGSF